MSTQPSFPLQLLIFVVLPLLALLVAVAFGGVALHQAEMRDMLVNHNAQVVVGAAEGLSDQLVQRREALAALQFPASNPHALQTALEQSLWLRVLFDGGVAIYSADGHLLAAWPADRQESKPELPLSSPLPAFVPLVQTGQNVTRIAILTTVGDLQVMGVTSLEALALSAVLQSLHESPSTEVYLLDTEGQVLYHSNPLFVGERLEDLPPVSGTREREDTVITSARVSAAQWTLVQEERWKETLSPLMRYSQAAPLALVPGLLIAMGAMWFGIRRIVYPLRRLEAQASELARGDFAAIEQQVGGVGEIRHLQATLQHMARRVQAAQVSMHDYIGAITRAQEDERRRLARELHDQTAQALVALGHRQQMLKPYLKDEPEAAELQAEIRRMIQSAIEDLRRIVRALRPVYLEELGLAPALQMLVRDLGTREDMTIHFEKTGLPRRLAPEHEIALYRIAQEALNNAWRHSNASQIWLSAHFAEEQVTISVKDNGKGFLFAGQATALGGSGAKHFGIMGMYERAALIGAQLHIQSEPGKGTTVTVQAPIIPASGPG